MNKETLQITLQPNEGLTRTNFWDQLQVQCPYSSKLFAAWWRQYRDDHSIKSPLSAEIDIFDLPFEMQYGLFLRFFIDLCKQTLIYPFLNTEPFFDLIGIEINGSWQSHGTQTAANNIVLMFTWVEEDYKTAV